MHPSSPETAVAWEEAFKFLQQEMVEIPLPAQVDPTMHQWHGRQWGEDTFLIILNPTDEHQGLAIEFNERVDGGRHLSLQLRRQPGGYTEYLRTEDLILARLARVDYVGLDGKTLSIEGTEGYSTEQAKQRISLDLVKGTFKFGAASFASNSLHPQVA